MQESNFSSLGAASVPPGWRGETTLERLLARFCGREMATLAEAAEVLGLSRKALAGWAADGSNWLFPVDLLGGVRRVRVPILAEFIGGRRWSREELRGMAIAQRQGLDTCPLPTPAEPGADAAPARRGRGRPPKVEGGV